MKRLWRDNWFAAMPVVEMKYSTAVPPCRVAFPLLIRAVRAHLSSRVSDARERQNTERADCDCDCDRDWHFFPFPRRPPPPLSFPKPERRWKCIEYPFGVTGRGGRFLKTSRPPTTCPGCYIWCVKPSFKFLHPSEEPPPRRIERRAVF